ncbi:MAG TPA: GntR family transcriptional regulator [Cytophagaceae bacterium]|jgi:DNA-binding transcriptional regulator YhcF (GntR family)
MRISIDNVSFIPKYRQIINSVIKELEEGNLEVGQQIPSINEISERYYLSRDTVEKAYTELKSRGIVSSVKGKGYYIQSTETGNNLRIFLCFNKISTYKKTVYNAFIKTIGENAKVDLFIHHNNFTLFKNHVKEHVKDYNYFVIIPPLNASNQDIARVLYKIPAGRLLLLDKEIHESPSLEYSSVYQDFRQDIYQAMHSGADLLEKYHELIMVFPSQGDYSKDVVVGFKSFCNEHHRLNRIVDTVEDELVVKGKAFIVVEEEDLVKIIKTCQAQDLVLGLDVGILSYNDTPMKEILANGITVMSTDFEKMGTTAAQFILDKTVSNFHNPFHLIRRQSL